LDLPFARLLNAIWRFVVRNADKDQRADLEHQLASFAAQEERHNQPARPGTARERQRHHAGLAPPNIRPPSWWKGDQHAYRSSVQAMSEISEADRTGGASLGRSRTSPRAAPRGRRR
jgi:hypothetical protein